MRKLKVLVVISAILASGSAIGSSLLRPSRLCSPSLMLQETGQAGKNEHKEAEAPTRGKEKSKREKKEKNNNEGKTVKGEGPCGKGGTPGEAPCKKTDDNTKR